MIAALVLAWRQLVHHKVKLCVALAGVAVAVMLMLVQLGIRQGAMDTSVAFTRRITADAVVVSPRTRTIFSAASFPRRLLHRLRADERIEQVQEISIAQARWRNPWNYFEHPISIYGIPIDEPLVELPGYDDHRDDLRPRDRAIFDARSRATYGPVVETLAREGAVEVEVNRRRIRVIGSVPVGVSITTDGNLYMTPENFLRLLPGRPAGAIDLGLVKVRPGADVAAVCHDLQPYLGAEATIMSSAALVAAETAFMRETAPVDFIFGMGAAVGFFIGFVVVYQILYTEVANQLPKFATLKAIGFGNGFLLAVVLGQAMILSLLGYVPGFVLAIWLYDVATAAIEMPFFMTAERAVMVAGATVLMCALSAIMAVRKVQSADPADVF
jgi:putative ABC transport system permease protein